MTVYDTMTLLSIFPSFVLSSFTPFNLLLPSFLFYLIPSPLLPTSLLPHPIVSLPSCFFLPSVSLLSFLHFLHTGRSDMLSWTTTQHSVNMATKQLPFEGNSDRVKEHRYLSISTGKAVHFCCVSTSRAHYHLFFIQWLVLVLVENVYLEYIALFMVMCTVYVHRVYCLFTVNAAIFWTRLMIYI